MERLPKRSWYLASVPAIAVVVWAELALPQARMPAGLPLAPLAAATHAVESYWYGLPDAQRTQVLYDRLIVFPLPSVVLLFAFVYALWAGASLRRGPAIPWASLVIVAGAALASIAWYVSGWRYGMRYQGSQIVALYAVSDALSVAALGGIAAWAARRPSSMLNLVFHALGFAWLVVLAFPYLGETP
jgi:hypothetical protein